MFFKSTCARERERRKETETEKRRQNRNEERANEGGKRTPPCFLGNVRQGFLREVGTCFKQTNKNILKHKFLPEQLPSLLQSPQLSG